MNKKKNKFDILFYGETKRDDDGEVIVETLGLYQIAVGNDPHAEPDIALRIAIMHQLAYDEDYDYYNSPQFHYRCQDIGLNSEKVLQIVNKIWSGG